MYYFMKRAHQHVHKLVYGGHDDRDEITELGHEAVKGVVTVGTVGITAGLMGGILGSLK